MTIKGPASLINRIHEAQKIGLFLDYDGTLADFSETPDKVEPQPEVIALLRKMNKQQRFDIAVISGRRLSHIQKLIPVPGILLAGTYGIELIDLHGNHIERVNLKTIRAELDRIKPQWMELINPHQGFFLEDKNWSLALHAKHADPDLADIILQQASLMIGHLDKQMDQFRILGGDKFLEIAPRIANKGLALEYILSKHLHNNALLVYIGDDDKDEEAFEVILQHCGVAIKVGDRPHKTLAQLQIDSPASVQQYLLSLLESGEY